MASHAFSTLATVPNFILYMIMSGVVMTVYTAIYTRLITPHDDIGMVRSGNVSAAVALIGAWIGMALPMAALIVRSTNIFDFLLWCIVAGVVQIGAYYTARILLGRDMVIDPQRETTNAASSVIILGTAVVCGIANAACMLG